MEAVGLTGQMHGCVMLDDAGEVLRPALIWCDQRTQPQCDWLTETIGYERLIELTANPALPNFTLTKLLWVREQQPEIFAQIAHVLCPKDFVRLRMTGTYAMDMQEASGTLLLDVVHRRWSKEMAELTGIPMSWLPPLFEGPEICARISDAGAAATGLKAGIPVAAGAGDQGAGAVGMGILAPGSVSATIGTSGVVFAATAEPTLDPKGRLHTFCHAAPGVWHVMGVTNGAGLSFRYLRDTFFAGRSYEELTALAEQVAPRERWVAVGSVPVWGADAAPGPEGAGGVCGHYGVDHQRALCAGGAGGRGVLAAGYLHALCGAGDSGGEDPAGRRRRARSAVAADSGRCVWASGGVAGGGRGRSVWRCAAGRNGCGGVGVGGGSLRGDGTAGAGD